MLLDEWEFILAEPLLDSVERRVQHRPLEAAMHRFE